MTATATASRFAPSVLDPRDVILVAAWDNNPEDPWMRPSAEDRKVYRERMAPEAKARGGFSRCTVCGAALRYVVVVMLDSTGEFFVVGEDCAESLDLAAEIGVKVTALRASAAERRDNAKRVAQAEAYLAAHPAMGAFFALDGDFPEDLFVSLYKWGSLTERQESAALRYLDKAQERAERLAKEAALPTAPVVEGRIEILGEVVSVKEEENPFSYYGGTITKILVRDDRGFKVWGTAPSALGSVEKGARVAFTATVERSQKDETFGFYKRPAKARYLDEA